MTPIENGVTSSKPCLGGHMSPTAELLLQFASNNNLINSLADFNETSQELTVTILNCSGLGLNNEILKHRINVLYKV